MGRQKGGKNREWSKEEKFKYVDMVISGEKSSCEIEREYEALVNSFLLK